MNTSQIYPFVILFSFSFFLFSLRKLKFCKKNLKYLISILFVSLCLLMLKTPKILVFGEFFYLSEAEKIVSDPFSASQVSRPLGLSFIYSVFMRFGFSALLSAKILNTVLNLITPLVLFLALRNWKSEFRILIW